MSGKGKKGALRHISIHPADNGYSISHENDNGDSANVASPYYSPKPHVVTSRQAALDHLNKLMAAHEGQAPSDNDGDEAPAPPKAKGKLMSALRGR